MRSEEEVALTNRLKMNRKSIVESTESESETLRGDWVVHT